uniref:proline-rich protein HaeIII subfamily 1-like n=1 Tax=Agelaius phoeniceus TaxID=39638 RepID=UPI0023EB68A7|nr:proline-rich protein HaeIII subfamily 1-like [Agelaius phoeniceus]
MALLGTLSERFCSCDKKQAVDSQPTRSLGRLGFSWAAPLLTKLNQSELKALTHKNALRKNINQQLPRYDRFVPSRPRPLPVSAGPDPRGVPPRRPRPAPLRSGERRHCPAERRGSRRAPLSPGAWHRAPSTGRSPSPQPAGRREPVAVRENPPPPLAGAGPRPPPPPPSRFLLPLPAAAAPSPHCRAPTALLTSHGPGRGRGWEGAEKEKKWQGRPQHPLPSPPAPSPPAPPGGRQPSRSAGSRGHWALPPAAVASPRPRSGPSLRSGEGRGHAGTRLLPRAPPPAPGRERRVAACGGPGPGPLPSRCGAARGARPLPAGQGKRRGRRCPPHPVTGRPCLSSKNTKPNISVAARCPI